MHRVSPNMAKKIFSGAISEKTGLRNFRSCAIPVAIPLYILTKRKKTLVEQMEQLTGNKQLLLNYKVNAGISQAEKRRATV